MKCVKQLGKGPGLKVAADGASSEKGRPKTTLHLLPTARDDIERFVHLLACKSIYCGNHGIYHALMQRCSIPLALKN